MFYILKQYIKYAFSSKSVSKENSKFLNDFKENILKKSIPQNDFNRIQSFRKFHLDNNIQVNKEDYGAGSKTIEHGKKINTSALAKNVSVPKKYGKVLYNLVEYFKTKHVLELGTSLGISSVYFSKTNVTSIEGNSELAEYTAKTLQEFKFSKVKVINDKFDKVFENLVKTKNYDLIFVDGNHSKEATLRYFEIILKYKTNSSIVIFDDINWSFGMNNAWSIIKEHKQVKLSIDLFNFGIVFFDESFEKKENVKIWY